MAVWHKRRRHWTLNRKSSDLNLKLSASPSPRANNQRQQRKAEELEDVMQNMEFKSNFEKEKFETEIKKYIEHTGTV